MRHLLQKYVATGCLTIALICLGGVPHAQENTEYSVKAAYIYNFIKFIKWPGAFDMETRSSIDICALGDSDIMQAKEVFRKASTAKLSISLVRETSIVNAAQHCHVIFIGASEAARLKDVLSGLHGKPVLTVSDIDGFAERGGMIEFVLQDDKIKFVINPDPAEASALKIDARLLETAVKVIGR